MKLSDIKITPLINSLRFTKIDDSIYFSEKYSNYISNSRLTLLKKSPKNPDKFFKGLAVNYTFSDSLNRGSAVHECVLQPESFYIIDDINKPTGKTGAMADELYQKTGRIPTLSEMKEASQKIHYYERTFNEARAEELKRCCADYWKNRASYECSQKYYSINKTPIYLDVKSRNLVNRCINSLKNNNSVQKLLNMDGETGNEQAILLNLKVECPDMEPFMIRLKAKLDNYCIDQFTDTITINDIKTTGNRIEFFNDAITKFSYNREIAMYSYLLGMVAKHKYGLENPEIKGNFLVVEMGYDFNSKVVKLSNKLLVEGFKEFQHLLKLAIFYSTLPQYEGFREDLIDI